MRNFYEFHPYGKHHLFDNDIKSVVKVLKSKNLTQGPTIEKFENEFKNYVGSKYAVAVSSCSAGLHLACKAAGLDKSNELLTSPNTFVSSASAGLHCGSKVNFVDIDSLTGNISMNLLKKINKKNKIKVVMPVHFGGLPCDMRTISKIIKKRKKYLLSRMLLMLLGLNIKMDQ